jgi:hypothetical protein
MIGSDFDPKRILEMRHPEYLESHRRQQWLLDSWEGGERYRNAEYGIDSRGLPIRNMIRHKREYPDPLEVGSFGNSRYFSKPSGSDQAAVAMDDDYELRRARTPVPTFVAEAVDSHLSKIYSKEIDREVPSQINDWLVNVDGARTEWGLWVQENFGPLLVLLGQIDVIFGRPEKPKDAEIRTKADEIAYGLNTCVIDIILPTNMVWWCLNKDKTYQACLVREPRPEYLYGSVGDHWRYWTETQWTLYDSSGRLIEGPEDHSFGRVPIIRLFDRRRPRLRNTGMSRYESIAEIQREYYNRDSELILSDTTQAHPLLQGPEDYIQPDGTIPIGPNWLLPKKKNTSGGSASYEGFDVVDFPKGGADSIRTNKHDLRDQADRAACLTKPAGAAGTSGGTVSQSGVSKQLDAVGGNELLAKLANVLAKAEERILEMVNLVLTGQFKTAKDAGISVRYPSSFDLYTADELSRCITSFQSALAVGGQAPETETKLLTKQYMLMMPGLDEECYEEAREEIRSVFASRRTDLDQSREMGPMLTSGRLALEPPTMTDEEPPADPEEDPIDEPSEEDD